MGQSFNVVWEDIHSSQEWGAYPAEHVIRFIARNYYGFERNNVKILDFGCGAGAHTWYLAREGFDVYAFDGSQSAIKRTQARLERDGLSANLKVTDALDTGYPDDFFDAVVDNFCIYSNLTENIQSMYKGIWSILKPQGRLCTACFGKRTTGYGKGELLEKDTYTNLTEGALAGRGITHFFSKEALKMILSQAGFHDIHIDTILYTDNQNQVEQYIARAAK